MMYHTLMNGHNVKLVHDNENYHVVIAGMEFLFSDNLEGAIEFFNVINNEMQESQK